MKKVLVVCIVFTILFGTFASVGLAADNSSVVTSTEEKVTANVSLDDQFADDRVMVVLSHESSFLFKDYSVSTFSDLDCCAVLDLSFNAEERVKAKYDAISAAVASKSFDSLTFETSDMDVFNKVLCIKLNKAGKQHVIDVINELSKWDDVIYAGPDYMLQACSTTSNDPYRANQWAIENIHLDTAWDITSGSSSVTVGVIDTGIDAMHPDLNGRVNISASRSFLSGTTQVEVPTDPAGHGTHVAGIIGAKGNNGAGVVGSNWQVLLVSLKAFDETRCGYASNVARAINYADGLDIPILNLSARWVSSGQQRMYYDYAFDSVIENYSGLLVCSAGNDCCDIDYSNCYPASYGQANILSVGNSTASNSKYATSNYGAESVDVFAPGDNILSCYPTEICSSGQCDADTHIANGYHYMSGTSMAAPYVAGVAALMLSVNSSLTPAQLKQIIIDRCTASSSLSNYCVSGGVVNAYSSVLHALSPQIILYDKVYSVSIGAGEQLWYKFTAPFSGMYYFTTFGVTDTVGELFGSSSLIAYDDNGNAAENFYIQQGLLYGQTVYLRVTVADGTASSFVVTVGKRS